MLGANNWENQWLKNRPFKWLVLFRFYISFIFIFINTILLLKISVFFVMLFWLLAMNWINFRGVFRNLSNNHDKAFFANIFNPFHVTSLVWYPLKTSGFLMFSEGIERDQWHEMGYGLSPDNYFHKKFHRGSITGFWIYYQRRKAPWMKLRQKLNKVSQIILIKASSINFIEHICIQ